MSFTRGFPILNSERALRVARTAEAAPCACVTTLPPVSCLQRQQDEPAQRCRSIMPRVIFAARGARQPPRAGSRRHVARAPDA